MIGVLVNSRKGGVGKTSLSHLLALGSSWFHKDAFLVHTDDRDPLPVFGRRYAYYDGREIPELETLMQLAVDNEGVFVIDSGGNRQEMDTWIAPSMDLSIVPVIPDYESITEGIKHFNELKKAGAADVKFVINQYPSRKIEQEYIKRYTHLLPRKDILCVIPKVAKTRTLIEPDSEEHPFQTVDSKVNKIAKAFYLKVVNHVKNNET